MKNNFINDKFDWSSLWRGVLLLFLLLTGGFLFLNQKGLISREQILVNEVVKPFKIVFGTETIGGDIEVLPPEPIKLYLPELQGELPLPENFTAQNMIVKDVETGMILYGKNEYKVWPIASLTKLMSALVLLEKNPDWTATTTVIGADSLDTHMYAGDVYTLEELWQTALIASSNKAILSLANALDWPEVAFVERMNQKAQELGMTETYFSDPSGLNDTNVSSASDLVLLLTEVMKNDKIKNSLLTKEYAIYSAERQRRHHMWNTNWLLLGWIVNDLDILGGKTGYIPASGYNFVMQVSDQNNHLINVVVLGANTHEGRFTEARDITQAVFNNYIWPN